MPLQVRCPSCQRSLQIPDSSAGQRLRCSGCQSEFQIGSAAPTPPAVSPVTPISPPAVVGRITFSCPGCKLMMQGRSDQAGQNARCPRCQQLVPIPNPAFTPSPIPPPPPLPPVPPLPALQAPPPKPPVAQLIDAGYGAAAPAAIPLAANPPTPKRLPMKRLGIGAAVGVLLLIGGIVLARSLFRSSPSNKNFNDDQPPPVSDLAFMQTDTMALIAVRPKDIWLSPPFQGVIKQLPPDVQEQLKLSGELGFDMNDFDRLTVVIKEPLQPVMWFVFKTNRPYDSAKRQELLNRAEVKIDLKEKQHEGMTYNVATVPDDVPNAPEPLALYAASDQVFVIGPEPGVKAALSYFKNGKKPGKLDAMLPLIEEGKHHVLIGAVMPPEGRQLLDQQKELLPPQLHDLTCVEQNLFKVDFGQSVKLELVAGFPDKDKAEKAREALASATTLGQGYIALVAARAGNEREKEVSRLLSTLLNGVNVKADNADVIVRTELDIDKLLPGWQEQVAAEFKLQTRRVNSEGNLKEIATALERYHTVHGHYPPAVVYSKDGTTPLYSWRVALLPFIGETLLYREFDLDQPWDSPKNKRLLARMPKVYKYPGLVDIAPSDHTRFQLLTGPLAAFDARKLVKQSDIANGLGKTILLVERRKSVPWSAPEDALVPSDRKEFETEFLPSLCIVRSAGTFPVALFDGTVSRLDAAIHPGKLRNMINPRGTGTSEIPERK